jgi:hypothetical protein
MMKDVRFGSKIDMTKRLDDVCLTKALVLKADLSKRVRGTTIMENLVGRSECSVYFVQQNSVQLS